MPNFVYDNVALPAAKTDLRNPVNPTRQWAADDANAVFTALTDIRTAILNDAVNVKQFGAVGDGVADDTAAIQDAIDATEGRGLYMPRGNYKVTSTLHITSRSHHVIGDFPNRTEQSGTQITYTGTGPCIEIGTDSGNPWSSNEYNGHQDHIFQYLYIKHGAPDTALTASGLLNSQFKTGSFGIWDWRGGGITMHRCFLEHFEANFVGVQSDINLFIECKSSLSKYGIYVGPRSDQNTFIALESLFCDRAITIDRAAGTRIAYGQFIGCGHNTASAIEIRRGSGTSSGPFGISIESCWFEAHQQAYQGTDGAGFVSVGEVDGYGAGGSIQSPGPSPITGSVVGCKISDPKLITFLPAVPAHVKHLASVGKCQQFILTNPTHQNSGSLTNLVSLVATQATQTPTNVETQVFIAEVPSTLTDAKCYTNLGAGAPAVNIDKNGATGRVFSSNVTLGGAATAAHAIAGTVTHTAPANTNNGAMLVQNNVANTGNSTSLRGLHIGTVDTSGGFRQAIAIQAAVNATRSAGASTLQNVGLQATATGGQDNQAIRTLDGDVQLNTSTGATVLNKSYRLAGELVPATITVNENNYSPTGFADAATVLVQSTGPVNITGFAGGATGREIVIYNVGVNTITITHQDAASTSSNRVIGINGANITLSANRSVILRYANSLARWLVVGAAL